MCVVDVDDVYYGFMPYVCSQFATLYEIYVKKLISLKHCVRSQITRLKLQKSFCDLEHGASL